MTLVMRAAWDAYLLGRRFADPTPQRDTETFTVHVNRLMFEQGWYAALAAAEAAPLDVERLEGAVYAAAFSATDDLTDQPIGYEEVTERIAREYAALRSPDTAPKPAPLPPPNRSLIEGTPENIEWHRQHDAALRSPDTETAGEAG
jgi:hypothetical protein